MMVVSEVSRWGSMVVEEFLSVGWGKCLRQKGIWVIQQYFIILKSVSSTLFVFIEI